MKQESRIVPHSVSQKRCELKMAQYVIKDEVCFRAVEKSRFVALVNEFEQRLQMSGRKKVAAKCFKNSYVLCDSLSMFALQIELEEKCIDSDLTLSKVAKAIKLKFEKYWGI
ncbi:hypothetical protein SASPL_108836 [Salvia splendens]|uniref:Uncharacterized protein n=1 Tax=Salvia splendens TaxID=180675 RepID=A0A8X8YDT8_SALSN|nr:hypothetical protein SASPL_108836 [Salvia splendens]